MVLDASGIRVAAFHLDPRPPQTLAQEWSMSASALQLAVLLQLFTPTSIAMASVRRSAQNPNGFVGNKLQSEVAEEFPHGATVDVFSCRAAHSSLGWGLGEVRLNRGRCNYDVARSPRNHYSFAVS